MYIYYIAILRFVTHKWVSNLKVLIDPFLFNSFVVWGGGGGGTTRCIHTCILHFIFLLN